MHCSFSELEVISPLSIPEIMPQIKDLIQGKLTAMNPKSGLLSCYHDSVVFVLRTVCFEDFSNFLLLKYTVFKKNKIHHCLVINHLPYLSALTFNLLKQGTTA